jgi:pyridinium-3,5-biscarboxylic acid mononucleotide synthase
MTRHELRALLEQVRSGAATPEAAHERILQFLRQAPFEDIGFARIDHHRRSRQGFPEVIFGPGKTPEQIAAIAERIVSAGHNLLVITHSAATPDPGKGTVLIAAAGTADLPVAEEAAICAEAMGNTVDRLYDVGVAGLHRLLAQHARLTAARVVIVAAGMEGALPSVVGGLVDVPVIAVPTSVGYGAAFAGVAPLLTMLNACSANVVVVNIDAGFKAGYVAALIARRAQPAPGGGPTS